MKSKEALKKARITARRKANNLCIQCGTRPPVTKMYCQRCRDLRRKYDCVYKKARRDRLKSVQFCSHCGNETVKQYVSCLTCRAKINKHQRNYLKRLRVPCIQCGAPRSHTSKSQMCRGCAYKYVWYPKMKARLDAKRAAA